MSYTIKQTTNKANTIEVEVKIMHGDADIFKTLLIDTFSSAEHVKAIRYKTLFEEMKIRNEKYQQNIDFRDDYNVIKYFNVYLADKWEEDTIHEGYAWLKEYKFFLYDENGQKHEIEIGEYEESDFHYYMRVEDSNKEAWLFEKENILVTDESLTSEQMKQFGFLPLPKPKEFLRKHFYQELEVAYHDVEDYPFYILANYGCYSIKTEEQENEFYDVLDDLESKWSETYKS